MSQKVGRETLRETLSRESSGNAPGNSNSKPALTWDGNSSGNSRKQTPGQSGKHTSPYKGDVFTEPHPNQGAVAQSSTATMLPAMILIERLEYLIERGLSIEEVSARSGVSAELLAGVLEVDEDRYHQVDRGIWQAVERVEP